MQKCPQILSIPIILILGFDSVIHAQTLAPPDGTVGHVEKQMFCGNHRVETRTICQSVYVDANTYDYCNFQSIKIFTRRGRNIHKVKFYYNFRNLQQPAYIVSASCHIVRGKTYISLQRSNFSNCKVCEWYDVVGVDGKYYGSSSIGIKNLINPFRFVPIDSGLAKILQDNSSKIAEIENTLYGKGDSW